MGEAVYAVVDFGRFVTGFLVVMGIGKEVTEEIQFGSLLTTYFSTTHFAGAYGTYSDPGYVHVHRWGLADIRHDHQFHSVL